MYEIDKKELGAYISQLRKNKGWTQKDVAEKLYISDKAVSKWETGVSIPDTALLIPLSELFGISTTELLTCGKATESPMEAQQVEDIVKAAISLSDKKAQRVYKDKGPFIIIYPISVLIGGIFFALNHFCGPVSCTLPTALILSVIFGAYFCLLAVSRLPKFYDENKIQGMADGILRMNVPGLYFNNSNWPHILNTGKIWSCLLAAVYPPLCFLAGIFGLDFFFNYELYIFLFLCLGGLFIPIYIVGKKYQ